NSDMISDDYFFFQAEDGIRDFHVTGVQTCALPILKCTLQRCQVANRTLETAALMPSWASETTSLTPLKPRLVSLRRNSVQIGSASDVPISMPRTSRRPSVLTPTAMMTATETMRPPRRTLR